MMRLPPFATLAFIVSVFIYPAITAQVEVTKFDGERTGSYIVELKPGVELSSVLQAIRIKSASQWDFINSFAADLDHTQINALIKHPYVKGIFEDGFGHIRNQDNAPWHLARLTSNKKLDGHPSSWKYMIDELDDSSSGAGVDIFIFDTGVYTQHSEFEDRAIPATSFALYSPSKQDNNGHGTHCAALAAGEKYGVAKKATIISVKVCDDWGRCRIRDFIDGLKFVYEFYRMKRRPSVISMSIGWPANEMVDKAVVKMVGRGVHFVVAAGNDRGSVMRDSPARLPYVITVGATDIDDQIYHDCNWGPVIDVFAPGVDIISAWIGGSRVTNKKTGTSMAAPQVAGLVAVILSRNGHQQSPADVITTVRYWAKKDVVGHMHVHTPNRLAHIPPIDTHGRGLNAPNQVIPHGHALMPIPPPATPYHAPRHHPH